MTRLTRFIHDRLTFTLFVVISLIPRHDITSILRKRLSPQAGSKIMPLTHGQRNIETSPIERQQHAAIMTLYLVGTVASLVFILRYLRLALCGVCEYHFDAYRTRNIIPDESRISSNSLSISQAIMIVLASIFRRCSCQ